MGAAFAEADQKQMSKPLSQQFSIHSIGILLIFWGMDSLHPKNETKVEPLGGIQYFRPKETKTNRI